MDDLFNFLSEEEESVISEKKNIKENSIGENEDENFSFDLFFAQKTECNEEEDKGKFAFAGNEATLDKEDQNIEKQDKKYSLFQAKNSKDKIYSNELINNISIQKNISKNKYSPHFNICEENKIEKFSNGNNFDTKKDNFKIFSIKKQNFELKKSSFETNKKVNLKEPTKENNNNLEEKIEPFNNFRLKINENSSIKKEIFSKIKKIDSYEKFDLTKKIIPSEKVVPKENLSLLSSKKIEQNLAPLKNFSKEKFSLSLPSNNIINVSNISKEKLNFSSTLGSKKVEKINLNSNVPKFEERILNNQVEKKKITLNISNSNIRRNIGNPTKLNFNKSFEILRKNKLKIIDEKEEKYLYEKSNKVNQDNGELII